MHLSHPPYDSSNESAFWRTGVAKYNPGQDSFPQLTSPLPFNKDSLISSAGSCFAQHLGHWLIAHQYQFLQSSLLDSQVSSFAFGNLYTAKSLLQWLQSPDELSSELTFTQDEVSGKLHDLLLLSGPAEGFDNLDQLFDYRRAAITEAKKQLAKSNCFVFTLGLTESWEDINGVTYPICPGTQKGIFNPDLYHFRQFCVDEIKAQLHILRSELKLINPELNIVLTVSPVPLTATASKHHILIANTYSKSALRAAAGEISDLYDDVFYFPSYELITTTIASDPRFIENRRTVSADGVNYVMKHWAASLGDLADIESPTPHLETECDEEKIDAINKLKRQADANSSFPERLILIGDSHLGKLAKAFERLNVPHSGGMIMNGSGFAQHKFVLCDEEYMVPLESAGSRKLWGQVVQNLAQIKQQNLQAQSCIITNIGLQTHQTGSMFIQWMRENRPERMMSIETHDYVDFFSESLNDHLSLLCTLKAQGYRVIMVSDTPFCLYFEETKAFAPFLIGYMDAMQAICEHLNIEYFHAARTFVGECSSPLSHSAGVTYADGQQDWYHGGDSYYEWLALKLQVLVAQ